MNYKKYWRLIISLLASVGSQSCEPEQIGFLNEHMRYNVAELQAVQGSTVSTVPLIANGSTTPMTVELLEIRDKSTGQPVPEFLQPKPIHVYLSQIQEEDTTLEQILPKIGTAEYAPITVNELGGMVTLSPTTEDIPPGQYTIDLKVENISGVRVIKEALDINLLPMKPDTVLSSAANTSEVGSDSETTAYADIEVEIEHIAGGEDKIIFMWIDRDGHPFNPKVGEVARRAALPSFADWSPFYEEEVTDTAFVYPYPYYKGLVYPLKSNVRVAETSFDNNTSNYRIFARTNKIRQNVNTAVSTRFYKPGTHIVRHKLTSLVRTGFPTPVVRDFQYSVNVPVADGYTPTEIEIDSVMLAEVLDVSVDSITTILANRTTFYAKEPSGDLNSNSTATAPGHWFGEMGNVVSWGEDARLFSEFKPRGITFNIGQFPGQTSVGQKYTITQMIEYDKVSTNELFQLYFTIKVTIVE